MLFVTNNYFDTLGARPALGRLLSSADSQKPGATPYIVLTHRFWSRRFREDLQIVGRELQINGRPFTVIGVAQEGFGGTTVFAPDMWVPMNMIADAMPRQGTDMLTSRRSVWMIMGARLKPGVTVEQAQAELASLGAALEREYPVENRGRGLRVVPMSPIPGNSAPVAAFLAGLMVVVGLVLAIACANVAGVLLARGTARRRELAVRRALGAGRATLVRQLLIETVVLFLAGAVLGVALAHVMIRVLMALLPALPVQIAVALELDASAIAFTAGVSVAAALLSGIVPALHGSRGEVVTALKGDAQGSPERMRLRNAFVVTQVAFSIVLVIGAGLFVRALQRASAIDPGFDAQGVEIASLDLSLGGYTNETGRVFARELIHRVRALPGVESATLSAMLPLGMGGMGLGGLSLPGADARAESIDADWNVVEPGYFATLRTPLLRGRDFTEDDREGRPFVAIVNETLARRAWPNQDPVGKVLVQGTGDPAPNDRRNLTIVGLARDAKYRSLGDHPRNFVYVPLQQQYSSRTNIVARAVGGRRLAADLRTLLATMSPHLPIVTSQTLEEYTSIALTPHRIAASVSGSLGIVGLLLAAIGIYGVTAYMVTTRTREIGIRMALGAERADVVRMVLRQGMLLVTIGVAIGLALAAAASRVLGSLLLGVGPLDPLAFGGAAVLFGIIGVAACYVPARRATEIEAKRYARSKPRLPTSVILSRADGRRTPWLERGGGVLSPYVPASRGKCRGAAPLCHPEPFHSARAAPKGRNCLEIGGHESMRAHR